MNPVTVTIEVKHDELEAMVRTALVNVISRALGGDCSLAVDVQSVAARTAPQRGFSASIDQGTVTDHRTGLMWSAEDVSVERLDWADADTACRKLRLAGYDDWRLPTRAELLTLVDDTRHEPAIDIAAFPTCKPNWYWTGTPCAWSPSDLAWIVSFNYGLSSYGHRDGYAFVRAVRVVSPSGQ